VNVGAACTTVVVKPGSALPFIRELPYAGNRIVDEIADAHGLSRRAVEQILWNPDENAAAFEDIAVAEAWRSLVNEINETVCYYVTRRRVPLEQVYVCGGFSRTKGFLELVSSHLPGQCILWNPLMELPCSPNVARLTECGPAFAVAAGLAMRVI
jgi:Tfp pilus assembly PilM family ATPase